MIHSRSWIQNTVTHPCCLKLTDSKDSFSLSAKFSGGKIPRAGLLIKVLYKDKGRETVRCYCHRRNTMFVSRQLHFTLITNTSQKSVVMAQGVLKPGSNVHDLESMFFCLTLNTSLWQDTSGKGHASWFWHCLFSITSLVVQSQSSFYTENIL